MLELQKKKIPAMMAVCLEHVGSHDEIGAAYRELNDCAKRNRLTAAGPAFTVFLDPPGESDTRSARFEVCLPVAAAPKADCGLKVRAFPACTVAYSVVKGPYNSIPAHYAEMLAWIDAEGMEIEGPPREVYVKHPDAAGKLDPKEYVTEIQFPLAE